MSVSLWIERAGQDVRFALRLLRRTPGFTIVVVLCLALGIGVNTAVFSWLEGILLRPYPGVADQDRLVAVANTVRGAPGFDGMSWPDFADLARSTTSFSAFIVSKITGATITGGERAERAPGLLVSANYFDALGVHMLLGRGFEPGDDVGRGAHPIVVISYRLWRDRYGGARDIVGRTISFNGVPHTIVGVTGKEFIGTFVGYALQFWVPASQQGVFDPSGYKLEDRSARWIEGFARLKPGVTIAQAQAEISAAARRLESDYPNFDRGRGIRLLPLWQSPFDNAKNLEPMLRVMAMVGVFVLLIVCANVANLLLVRSLSRRHEMTVRMAIGADRGLLLRQLVTEGALLATFGTALGLGAAYACRNILGLFFPPRGGITIVVAGAFDWRVALLGAAVGLGSTMLFALLPALQTSNVNLAGALAADSRSSVGSRGRARVRAALAAGQVCLSFVLLVGTGLLLVSMRRLHTEQPGFSTDNVLTTGVNLFAAGYDEARARRFDDELLRGLRSIAGVQSAALATSMPFSVRPYDSAPIAVDGYAPSRDEHLASDYNEVTPSYFATMGIPILSGRDFSSADADTSRPVAIVSQAFAAKYLPGGSPLGKRVKLGDRWLDIVAVAGDIKHLALTKPASALVYVPLAQHFSTAAVLVLRTSAGVAAVAPAVVGRIHAIDPAVSPAEIVTMREQVTRSTASQQIAVTLVALLAAVALFLAAVGLYGVIAFVVSQSTRELGLRMAIGASPADVLGLVLVGGLRLAAAGAVAGMAVSLVGTRLLGDLLFRVSPHDPLAFGAALALMLCVALGACAVPAWRAASTNPMEALRT